MLPVKILIEEPYEISARKIFYEFEVNQSCLIEGFDVLDDKVYSRGDLVWKEIVHLDMITNFTSDKKRRMVKIKNSNGAPVAHKLFKFVIREDHKYTIWRVQ